MELRSCEFTHREPPHRVAATLSFLAKSEPPETLETHTCAVWEQFWAFWRRTDLKNAELQQALSVAAFVHDFGKIHPGFQKQLQAAQQGKKHLWGHRHELLSAAFLRWFFTPKDPRLLWAAAAVLTHHKHLSLLTKSYPPDCTDDWAAPSDKLFEALGSAPPAGEAPPPIAALAEWTEKTFPAWWKAQSSTAFWGWAIPPTKDAHDPNWPQNARSFVQTLLKQLDRIASGSTFRTASAARQELFWSRGFILLADRLASAGGSLPTPVPWEKVCSGLPLSEALYPHQAQAQQSGSLLLVAPTGSGKTEAALLWAYAQHQQHPTNALLYVLPYQANLNAMWQRFQTRYALSPDEVALWHSRALLVQFLNLRDAEAEPAALNHAQSLHSHGQLMRPPVFLSTPYQLLKAAFGLPGHETLWTLFTHSLIIADEIHSYAPYRSGLFLGLLFQLTQSWKAHLCLMTATLPRWMEGFIQKRFSPTRVTPTAELYRAFTRHRLFLRRGTLLDQLSHAEAAARAGEKVLLVANTVRTAQEIYATLKERLTRSDDPCLLLLHSRFTAKDRLAKEKELFARLESSEGLLVVATQVVEVSLDVSFDRLYTELAPMEALIQRFGRVNRRREAPWKPVYVCTQPTSWKYPYGQPRLLRRVRRLLRALNGHRLAENRLPSLVQRSYGLDAQKLRKQLEDGFNNALQLIQDSVKPLEVLDGTLAQEYDALFDGEVVLPASLRQEYEETAQKAPLLAQLYLLSLPSRTLYGLLRQGKAEKDEQKALWIVHLPYNAESGLHTFSSDSSDDPSPTAEASTRQDFFFIE